MAEIHVYGFVTCVAFPVLGKNVLVIIQEQVTSIQYPSFTMAKILDLTCCVILISVANGQNQLRAVELYSYFQVALNLVVVLKHVLDGDSLS